MTLDQETKVSLQLSYRYLRAYDESKILEAMTGWLEVYGEEEPDVENANQEETAEIVPEVRTEDLAPKLTENTVDEQRHIETTPEVNRVSGGRSKVIWGIGFGWFVMMFGILFFIFG